MSRKLPATVLVVDDDRGLVRLIEKSLRREGFSTATAASGQEAIAWLSQHPADLMLLDLKLPDFEGRELIHRLTELSRLIPFIIITGQGDERVAVEIMKRGAVDYLIKDGKFLEFVPTVVQRALQQIEKDRKLDAGEQERQRLEQEILEISSREQRRIGHDLHDGLCQHLAGIELMSQVLAENLAKKSRPEAPQAAQIADHVRAAIAQTRILARGLSPVERESGGLMAALEELASNTEQLFRIQCRFECKRAVFVRDNAAATHLYRIAQEAINNSIKHGKAREVVIRLSSEDGQAQLSIVDNGAGFPETLSEHGGMGLRIMRYRAGTLGATLEIRRGPDRGTVVICTFQKDL